MSEEPREEPVVQQALSRQAEPEQAVDLEGLFREHSKRVLRAAYRVTGNSNDAEDVLQTVFMRLVRREGGAALSQQPGSYLHRAAINAALDLVRSRHVARTDALDEPSLAARAESGSDPERARESEEIRGYVREALARLTPKSAEIFALRYFEGYGNHEIARMLGTSRGTVNVILHRARRKIREEIGPRVGETP